MVEDSVENLIAAIQLIEDFTSSTSVTSHVLDKRKEVFSNLLIDSFIRVGDILQFKEAMEDAIDSFKKAVALCK
jgi:hypothetical protein